MESKQWRSTAVVIHVADMTATAGEIGYLGYSRANLLYSLAGTASCH